MRKITEKVNGNKSWFFKSIRKMDKYLVILMGEKEKTNQIIDVREKLKHVCQNYKRS